MTAFLPLKASNPPPQNPSYLVQPQNVPAHLSKAIQAIVKAKRLVVVCGAGISVHAGIPDFRSAEGLFKSLKRDYPRESVSSGKDLFDASVFTSEQTTSLFCQMIARLSELSHIAQPTPFHRVLRALDDHGKLLRVYTQNIDAIEEKCGLSFGVPEFEGKRYRPRGKGKLAVISEVIPSSLYALPDLQSLLSFADYSSALAAGQPPQCPECTSLEQTRQLVGKRPRGIGKLRPSVVLYNEAHKDGEGVGEVVRKDLIGTSKGKGRSGADVLLVVGTSLQVPGTKRMVREFAKAVRSRGVGSTSKDDPQSSGSSSRATSPGRSLSVDEDAPIKAVYLNLDFPVPTREWEGVFDVWIQGDAQQFAGLLQEELQRDSAARALAVEKKRKRKEEIAITSEMALPGNCSGISSKASKRPKMIFPLSPPRSPSADERPLRTNIDSGGSKLILRIPPLSNPRRLIPEVCITTLPRSIVTPGKNKVKDRVQLPLTPDESPPKQILKRKGDRQSVRIASQTTKACHRPPNQEQVDILPDTSLLSVTYELPSTG
ncbi:DHS-like NAD/FAD-binding domain-containing protein [Cyathus striatus]|nr:DHS-like NAD/FAD-binding domain-containing protein [Cyathus striatus]